MYKRILLTVDLNHPKSWAKALPEAAGIASAYDSELHVLHVVPAIGSSLVASFLPPEMEAKALKTAKADLDALVAQDPAGARVTATHIGHGTVHEEILKQITALTPDLVVMASHAPDRVREFLVGSEADRVVRRSPVSVLVVRD